MSEKKVVLRIPQKEYNEGVHRFWKRVLDVLHSDTDPVRLEVFPKQMQNDTRHLRNVAKRWFEKYEQKVKRARKDGEGNEKRG